MLSDIVMLNGMKEKEKDGHVHYSEMVTGGPGDVALS